jgi:Mlc titration factor MtfA (ptsG expression regulator)
VEGFCFVIFVTGLIGPIVEKLIKNMNEIAYEGVDCINPIQDMDQWNTVMKHKMQGITSQTELLSAREERSAPYNPVASVTPHH